MTDVLHALAGLSVVLGACSSGTTSSGASDAALASDASPVVIDAAAAPEGSGRSECVPNRSEVPHQLALPHVAPNGNYDPSAVRDPLTGRLWLVYSTVRGPGGAAQVSTHIASSDDDGRTWCDAGVVNPSQTTSLPAELDGVSAHWSHETPALVHLADAPRDRRWMLLWHRYLHVEDGVSGNEDRQFAYGWIAARRSETPELLLDAPEIKLFSTRAYHLDPRIEAFNDAAPGGRPEHRWDADPSLGDCLVFTEPGGIWAEGALHVAMACARSASDISVILVRHEPARDRWVYGGTLLDRFSRVSGLEPHRGFNGPDIVRAESGTYRLLVSPIAEASGYSGCVAYELDLPGAKVSDPVVLLRRTRSPGIYQSGPCTYAGGSRLGVLSGDTYLQGVQFRLIATGQRLD